MLLSLQREGSDQCPRDLTRRLLVQGLQVGLGLGRNPSQERLRPWMRQPVGWRLSALEGGSLQPAPQ